MGQWLLSLTQIEKPYLDLFQAVLRYVMPALALLLLIRCMRPLLTFRRENTRKDNEFHRRTVNKHLRKPTKLPPFY